MVIFSLRDNEAVAPPLLDTDWQRGWTVSEIDGSFRIQRPGLDDITATEDVRNFVLTNSTLTGWYAAHNQPEEQLTMTTYDDSAANDASPELAPYLDSTVAEIFIGHKSKSPIKVRSARKQWAELARVDGLVLNRVTLAAQPGEPGADQIVALALPDGLDDDVPAHALFVEGERAVAILRYMPVTTYPAVNQVTGEVSERASNFDDTGYVSIVKFTESVEQADQLMARLRELVMDYYRPERSAAKAAKAASAESWGV